MFAISLPIALYYVIPFLVFVAVLFFIVRGAVLSALRKHTAESRANPPTTAPPAPLGQDGL